MTEKKRILTISDMPVTTSGVANQTRYIIEGLIETGKYEIVSLGAALEHPSDQPFKIHDDWTIIPTRNYGDPALIRNILFSNDIDALWFMTDPRFYIYLFNMADEIKDRGIPMLYYHVWDNDPYPRYNRQFYLNCDFIGCISKLTLNIVNKVSPETDAAYIPHAVDPDVFKPLNPETIKEEKKKILEGKDKFVIFYNSRNARRKGTSDVIKIYRQLLDKVGEDKTLLLMHTSPNDREGANLIEVAKKLKIPETALVFSQQKLNSNMLNNFYNIADMTVCMSNQEGFGLSCLESLMAGTPVVATKTGGLQDQVIDSELGEELGAAVVPKSRHLTGSQEIPYIYADYCNDEDWLNAFLKIYNMKEKEKLELSKKCSESARRRFKLHGEGGMVKLWEETIEKYINIYKNQNNSRIKIL